MRTRTGTRSRLRIDGARPGRGRRTPDRRRRRRRHATEPAGAHAGSAAGASCCARRATGNAGRRRDARGSGAASLVARPDRRPRRGPRHRCADEPSRLRCRVRQLRHAGAPRPRRGGRDPLRDAPVRAAACRRHGHAVRRRRCAGADIDRVRVGQRRSAAGTAFAAPTRSGAAIAGRLRCRRLRARREDDLHPLAGGERRRRPQRPARLHDARDVRGDQARSAGARRRGPAHRRRPRRRRGARRRAEADRQIVSVRFHGLDPRGSRCARRHRSTRSGISSSRPMAAANGRSPASSRLWLASPPSADARGAVERAAGSRCRGGAPRRRAARRMRADVGAASAKQHRRSVAPRRRRRSQRQPRRPGHSADSRRALPKASRATPISAAIASSTGIPSAARCWWRTAMPAATRRSCFASPEPMASRSS